MKTNWAPGSFVNIAAACWWCAHSRPNSLSSQLESELKCLFNANTCDIGVNYTDQMLSDQCFEGGKNCDIVGVLSLVANFTMV